MFLILIVLIICYLVLKVIKKIEWSTYNRFVKDLNKAQRIVDDKILVSKKELDNLCSTLKWTLYMNQYDKKYINNTSKKIYSQICSMQNQEESEKLQTMINKKK